MKKNSNSKHFLKKKKKNDVISTKISVCNFLPPVFQDILKSYEDRLIPPFISFVKMDRFEHDDTIMT